MDSSRLLIGDLAGQAGIVPSTIRYYETTGLLGPEARTESGYRIYGQRAANRLRFIRRAKTLGFKLSEIKRLINAPRGAGEDELVYFNRILASKLEEIQSQIAYLRVMARDLHRLELALRVQPPPERCHLGDCTCWLPD